MLSWVLLACSEPTELPDAGVLADGAGDAVAPDGPRPCTPAITTPLELVAGAFPAAPGRPNAIVHYPPNFDPTPPTTAVVYLHGHRNCITNVLGDTDTPCTPGGPARSAFQLATQLAASQRNAILVLPEVRYDEASGDPGQLGVQDGLRDLLAEALPGTPLDRVIVASHSGGYIAAARSATLGGIPVDEVWLYDSLYGETSRFDAYVQGDLPAYAGWPSARRFGVFYIASGGTQANSQAMANRAAGWVAPADLVDDRTSATWPDATYQHGLLFKFSALSHDGVARYYFARSLATSSLRATSCSQ